MVIIIEFFAGTLLTLSAVDMLCFYKVRAGPSVRVSVLPLSSKTLLVDVQVKMCSKCSSAAIIPSVIDLVSASESHAARYTHNKSSYLDGLLSDLQL